MKQSLYIGRSVQEDLEKDLRDPEFAEAFVKAKARLYLRKKIRALAEEKGVGIRELARRMGTSPAQVMRLFKSPAENWRLDTLIKFSVAIGKTLNISFK